MLRAGLTKLKQALTPAELKGINNLDELPPAVGQGKAAITAARRGGWCFIAGTMICTASGSVPIEQIQPGDWVYSAHERTGELSLRPVMELYRNVVPEIWTVAYDHDHDHDPATPDATLDCTPGHPFWSEDVQAFISASDLSAGSRVRLITGESARVAAVHPRRGPPTGRGTTVYNFAVAEHHTYFAGAGGVWVHNVCPAALGEPDRGQGNHA
jgi:hypothetical protein